MQRRTFIQASAWGAAAWLTGRPLGGTETTPENLARNLPRWRGFNLQEKFIKHRRNPPFRETDFKYIADWGFDFVRLPMDYRIWTRADDPFQINERELEDLDEALEFGRKYGIHVMLNLHRAPGYTVAQPPEKLNLWKDEAAQKQFLFQWTTFAKRYRGIPAKRLSFNLVNEPTGVSAAQYVRIMRQAIAAIRREDPGRLIFCDGLEWGRRPIEELADSGVAQCTRGYEPFHLTHYGASWIPGAADWPKPTWPLKENDGVFDRQWLLRNCIGPWKKIRQRGIGVMVGEWGVYDKTPHSVALAWMRDCLELWKGAGWGWALWGFRGGFGLFDSGRSDVAYEDFHGRKLDRKMLDLLQKY